MRDDRGGDLSARVGECLQRHAAAGRRLTLGYSGGLDSSVLLHLLAGLRASHGFTLSALHVHHGLSPQAEAWASHCAQICHRLQVPLDVRRVAVQPAGEGLEAAARAARYCAYRQLDTDFLLLAHHRDDLAETVLLQLLRGAGMKGLAAMPEARRLCPGIMLLRPLLASSRQDISASAAQIGLDWVEDGSNLDLRLSRNALRHAVMPGLSQRFPDAPKVLAQAAARFAEAADLLDALAEQDGREAIAGARLAIASLRALPEPRARNLLRHFLEQAGAEIHADGLREALRQLLQARPDACLRIEFGTRVLRRHQDSAMVEVLSPAIAQTADGIRVWHGELRLLLGEPGNVGEVGEIGEIGELQFQPAIGEGVRLTPGEVSIRARRGGERLRPGPGRPRRTLKNLLREAGIPAWQREHLPLIYVGDQLAWVAGVGADSDFLSQPGESGWLVTWLASPNRAG